MNIFILFLYFSLFNFGFVLIGIFLGLTIYLLCFIVFLFIYVLYLFYL